jgi:DNA-binding HxlR family transcriptional regulator
MTNHAPSRAPPFARAAAASAAPASPSCNEGKSLCPVLAAVEVIGTEWRLAIVHTLLLGGKQRFSQLLRSNPKLNAKTLSATLKHLEGVGVVQRTVVSTRPFKVEYSLTEMGTSLRPATNELRAWGERFIVPRLAQARATAAATARSRAIAPELPPVGAVAEAQAAR